MAFSLLGILAVVLEVIRPLLPLLLGLLVVEVFLLAGVVRGRRAMQFQSARRMALAVFAAAFVIALLAVPPFTGAGFGSMSGALDWLALTGAAFGIGLAVALASWAPLQLLLGRKKA